jgi:type II secretory pathway component PulF
MPPPHRPPQPPPQPHSPPPPPPEQQPHNVLTYETGYVPLFTAPRLSGGVWLALAIAFTGAAGGALFLIAAALWNGVSPLAGAPAPLVGLFLMAVASGVLIAGRRGRAHAVLAYVEQAVRLNLPLHAMLQAAERAERGRVRLAVRAVRHRLEEGSPVAVAVAAGVPSLPQRTIDLIAAAERAGRLPQVLRRITRPGGGGSAAPGAAQMRGDAFLRWYPLLTLLILGVVFVFACVYVMPKFQQIFEDFGTELPAVTRWAIWAAPRLVIPLTAALALLAVGMLGRTAGTIFAPGWAAFNPLRGVTDRLAWRLPPFRAAVRPRATADACHVIADAMESGRPLAWAIDEAARVQTNVVLERRLLDWADRVRQGVDAADAARDAGLPELLAGTFRAAGAAGGGGGGGPDMLRFLARYYEGRFSRAAALARAALLPAAAILTGIPVCLFVLSMFLPLTRLIDYLSEVTWSV